MHIAPKLDAGDMIYQEVIDLTPDETGGSLHDRLADLGPASLAGALPKLDQRAPQDKALVTHCGKLGREDGQIDWSQPAEAIDRLIRAYEPWPGTYTTFADTGQKLKIFPGGHPMRTGARFEPRAPFLEDGNLVIGCENGDSALILTPETRLQLEGRKRVAVSDFVRGAELAGRNFH
jgi:methionyl-tRNA formyltransferase